MIDNTFRTPTENFLHCPLLDVYFRVDPKTLRAMDYDNVFAIGDCANTPNAKTAAAICEYFR